MENNKEIQKVTFGMLQDQETNVQYSDGDIVLLDNIADLVNNEASAYQLELVAMAFCTNGKGQFRINDKMYTMYKSDLAIITPMSIMEDVLVSPDFDCFVVGLSYNAIQHSVHIGKKMWDLRTFLIQNPIIHLQPEGQLVGTAYKQLLELKLKNPNELFYKEIMQSLFECVFFELASFIRPMVDTTTTEDGLKQGDMLCKRFIEMLTETEGRERSVSVFADKLCVTPKYLSTVTKETSGKTALEWIHIYAVENIKRQLKYSNKTIKEIADDMNFPNLSFFGKFVRTHLGVSPTEYRRQLFNEAK